MSAAIVEELLPSAWLSKGPRVHSAANSATCSKHARLITPSSTRTPSAASHRRGSFRRGRVNQRVRRAACRQMHNYHVVMARLNSPTTEFFPPVDVEVVNALFWYIFDGEPTLANGEIDLRDDVPGLALTIKEVALDRFSVIE